MPSVWLRAFFLGCLATAASSACTDTATKPEGSTLARTVAAQDDALAKTLAASRFEEDGHGGLIASTWAHVTKTRGLTFGAHLPASATGAFDLGLATKDEAASSAPADFALRVTHERFADAPLVNDAGRALYKDVAASTDLLVSTSDAKAEWFYLARDAAAPTSFAIDVALPKGLPHAKVRRDGSIAFLDARGAARLTMPTAYALDARGTKREVTLTWRDLDATHGRIEATYDVRGMEFPVLVDPAIAYPVWEEQMNAASDHPSARLGAAFAYDRARGVSILFGGQDGTTVFDDTWQWDGTTWTQLSASGAGARWDAPMAYDSARGVMVLFGGCVSVGSSSNPLVCEGGYARDTWEWNGTSWTERTSTAPPPARAGATMAYDSARSTTVLFGGNDSLTDTWEWDGQTWTQRLPTTSPPARLNPNAVYDAALGATILFGGANSSTYVGVTDMWSWDGTDWTMLTPPNHPSGRGSESLAYDSARSQIVLFGGSTNYFGGTGLSDTWLFDGTTWKAPPAVGSASPPERYLGAAAYDSARGVTVLFGGGDQDTALGDTWEWNGTSWTARTQTTGPSDRFWGSLVYESTRARSLLFGGCSSTTGSECSGDATTWEWDGTSWAQRSPSASPPYRLYAGLAFDSTRGKAVLFGGEGAQMFGDTWEWDGANWTGRTVISPPPSRFGHAMAYDSARRVTVIFGGCNGGVCLDGTFETPNAFLNDTWEWNGTLWTMRSPATSPPGRSEATMVYDSGRARMVLFGGQTASLVYGTEYDARAVNDTWEYDGTTWSQVVTAASPSARLNAGMAYDSVRGKTILFGGASYVSPYASSGFPAGLGDTWEYDGTNWTSPSLASPSARQGEQMTFDPHVGVVMYGGSTTTAGLNDLWLYVSVATSCTTSATCDSGSCLDGVCCEQSACGPCQSCALPGHEGKCTNVPDDTVPTTGDTNACKAPNVCTASGVCGEPDGDACGSGGDCYSGFCVDGVCCDTACTGDCQACSKARGLDTNGTCAFAPDGTPGRNACTVGYACNGKGAACATSCTDDATCAAGYFCGTSGTCVVQKSDGATCDDQGGKDCLTSGCHVCAQGNCVDGACCASCQGTADLGTACTNDAQCGSNHCVGGICCGNACAAAGDAGSSACSSGVCDVKGGYVCVYPGSETTCRATACTDATLTLAAACDGRGNCGALEQFACADGFACASDGLARCNMSCSGDSDCQVSKSYHCANGICVAGVTCSADGTEAIAASGTKTACSGGFNCGANGCKTACTSVNDCQAGYSCSQVQTCVPSAVVTPAPASGCSCDVIGGARSTRGAGMATLAAIALVVGRRKRRWRGGRTRVSIAALLVVTSIGAVTGCTDSAGRREGADVAGTLAAHDEAVAKGLAGSRFVEDGRGGLVARAWRDETKARGLTFGARVPASATGAFDVGLATRDEAATAANAGDYVLRVTHRGFTESPLVNDAGRARYTAVAPSTDLLVSNDAAATEWFYLVHDASAPAQFTLDVTLPKGLPHAAMHPDGSLVFADARNATRLTMPAPHLVDARGVKRAVAIAWSDVDATHGRIAVTYDAGGLAFPLLVDPAIVYPLWENVSSGTNAPSARAFATSAYDSARNVTVLFGGQNGTAALSDTWEWDGTTWTQRSVTGPSPRWNGSMTFDSARNVTVLYGGCSAVQTFEPFQYLAGCNSGATYNDTWEWDGTAWTESSVALPPPARMGGAMAYDPVRQKTVLFGGYSTATYGGTNDTWEWDGATWANITPVASPSVRFDAGAAYDRALGRTVFFGGFANGPSLGDTWGWDGTSWTNLAPTASPPSRGVAAMSYDSARAAIVLFGGASYVSNATGLGDEWEFSGTTWTHGATLTPMPSARFGGAMTYDVARGLSVLFGGVTSGAPTADTWTWDGTTWTARATAIAPSARVNGSAAFDSARGETVLFGGCTAIESEYGCVSDLATTWVFAGTTWTQRAPATAPPARSYAAMVYDSARGKTVLFGGQTANYGETGDTWEWDGTTWLARTNLGTTPSARAGAAAAYDSVRGKTVLFGGCTSYIDYDEPCYSMVNDTWEWDGTTWTAQAPATSPSARTQTTATFDAARGKMIVNGGGGNIVEYGGFVEFEPLAETWEWDGTNWAQAPTGPTGLNSAMAYDSVRGRAVLFGGSYYAYTAYPSGNGATWEYDGTSWTSPSLASPGARQGAVMTFDTHQGVVLYGGSSTTALNDTWLYVSVAASCTTSTTCDSGSCVDGVCCAQSSCGACQSCAIPGAEGQCTNVPAGTVPATSDPNACAAPNECTAGGACGLPNSAACTDASACFSGFCVDGVCCDSACTGDCQACSTSRGLNGSGTCTFAPEGTSGRTTCANDFMCNGKGPTCATACTDDATCAAGFYCSASGTCLAQKSEGAACDDRDGKDCLASGCHVCAAGNCVDNACCATCQGTDALGVACTNDAQCESTHCVGGICCGTACPALAGDGGSGASVCASGVCDVQGGYVCAYPGTTTTCRATQCAMATLTLAAVCDGSGSCSAVQSFPCPDGFGCTSDGANCNTTCTVDTDCNPDGYHCSGHACVIGTTCSADGTQSIAAGGKVTTCSGGFNCGASGCKTTCASVNDCQAGYSCSPLQTCVAIATTAPANSGCSCGVAGHARNEGAGAFALVGLACVAARRRRRRSRPFDG